jgi:hypothetical protein
VSKILVNTTMFGFVSLTLAAGCKTGNERSSAMNDVSTSAVQDLVAYSLADVGDISCQGGEAKISLGLKPATSLPSPDQTPFAGATAVVTVDSSKDFNLRLDACYDETSGEATLQRIVQRTQYDLFVVISIKEDAVVTGLTEAVLGETSALKIVNKYTKWYGADVDNQVTIQSFKVGTETMVGVNHEMKQGDAYVPFTAPDVSYRPAGVVVGALELFDPFADGMSCNNILSRVFVPIQQARIEFTLCIQQGTAGSWGAQYLEVAVIDNHESLPAGVKGERIVTTDIETVAQHHNICDSMRISTPSADYLLTSGPAGLVNAAELANCTGEQAFVKNPSPKSGPWNMIYQIKYKNGKIEPITGYSDLQHWGKENPNVFSP